MARQLLRRRYCGCGPGRLCKEMDEKGLLHAVALRKQADPNPLMRPHVRHVAEALEEATGILDNILTA